MNIENQSTESAAQPPVAQVVPAIGAIVTHKVNDYGTWKQAFDQHVAARRDAGILASHINRSVDDPNLLSIYFAAADRAKLDAFFSSADLKSAMMEAGVAGPPTITLITPVEDHTQKHDPLFGMIAIHPVADFDAWKKVYDEVEGARQDAGIVGHAVNRSVDDTNLVIVYHQAESLEALQGFASSDELKSAMQRAGVAGPPTILFFEGAGWGN